MINYEQSVSEIVANSTPQQKILWNDIFLRFGENIAVRQYFHRGNLLGADILTYNPRYFYFIYEMQVYLEEVDALTLAYISELNENNVACHYIIADMPIGLGAVLNYMFKDRVLRNFYTSRLSIHTGTGYAFIKGFKIGI